MEKYKVLVEYSGAVYVNVDAESKHEAIRDAVFHLYDAYKGLDSTTVKQVTDIDEPVPSPITED